MDGRWAIPPDGTRAEGETTPPEATGAAVSDERASQVPQGGSGLDAAQRAALRDDLRDVLAGWPIGTGYYGTQVGLDEASEMADAVLDHLAAAHLLRDAPGQGAALRRARAEAWDEAAEATAEWAASNPTPSGIPLDPPRNPYDRDGAPGQDAGDEGPTEPASELERGRDAASSVGDAGDEGLRERVAALADDIANEAARERHLADTNPSASMQRAHLHRATAKTNILKRLRALLDHPTGEPQAHRPVDDDGATYCGWTGDGGTVDGCGEAWPCSTVRAGEPQPEAGEPRG